MTFKLRVPVKIFRFKPGDEAKAHPCINFNKGWEMGGDSDLGFPDSYHLKEGYNVEGNTELKDGDVLVEFADGTYTAMRGTAFDALYE